MTPQPETKILRAVREHLRGQGFYTIRTVAGIGSHAGLSDLIAVRDGITTFIEIKTPGGRLSSVQQQFQREIEEHGARYHVVRSVDDIAGIVGGCLEVSP